MDHIHKQGILDDVARNYAVDEWLSLDLGPEDVDDDGCIDGMNAADWVLAMLMD